MHSAKQNGTRFFLIVLYQEEILYSTLSVIFCKIFNLFHDFSKNLRTVLRGIAILDQTDLNIKLKLVADNLVIQPIRKRRFYFNDFFHLFCQRLAFGIDRNAIDNLICPILKMILVA